MTEGAPDTIVLIHGLWMTPLAWEHWVTRYEKRGFTVLTPGYPGIGQGEEGLEALRADPSVIADVGVREVVDEVGALIEGLATRRSSWVTRSAGRSPSCWSGTGWAVPASRSMALGSRVST